MSRCAAASPKRCAAPRPPNTGLQVQVEVDRIDQIEPALAAGADRLLLDNMDPPMLREAVALVAGRVPLEASGGVTLETIRSLAETGVDFISVGRITQSAPAVDIGLDYSLEVVEQRNGVHRRQVQRRTSTYQLELRSSLAADAFYRGVFR